MLNKSLHYYDKKKVWSYLVYLIEGIWRNPYTNKQYSTPIYSCKMRLHTAV